MADITLASLTEASLAGSGVYDVLMRTTKLHLEQEYSQNRITGPQYATVYLGSLESVLRASLDFLLQNQKIALEAQLLEKQIALADVEVEKAQVELEILKLNQTKIPAEIALLEAQKLQTQQQTSNLQAEKSHTDAQTVLVGQQKVNLAAEALNVPKQGALIDAQSALTSQQRTNAITENLVLQGQKCKLDAEYDLLLKQVTKTSSEILLLDQKTTTERAQTSASGVAEDSVVGRQKGLYLAQTNGFIRDAEQKAAKIMADTWNVRRTTDEGTSANTTNKLDDVTVGRAINKLLSGVGA